jgi:hypothetical protein
MTPPRARAATDLDQWGAVRVLRGRRAVIAHAPNQMPRIDRTQATNYAATVVLGQPLEFPGKQAGYRAGVQLPCWATRSVFRGRRSPGPAAAAGRAAPCGIRLPEAKPRSPTPTRPKPRLPPGTPPQDQRPRTPNRCAASSAWCRRCTWVSSSQRRQATASLCCLHLSGHTCPSWPSCRRRFTIVLIGPGPEDQDTQRRTERAESASLRQVINSVGATRGRS